MTAWETQAWLPLATANLPNIPLLSAEAAGLPQTPGRSTGLIYQNVDPPYAMPNLYAVVHWLPDAPLRTSAIRAPGKIANTFAVESFTDEIAALAKVDPVEWRLKRLTNPRAIEVLQRAAARMHWQARPSPRAVDPNAAVLTGRGIAFIHYKHDETLVAMGMEVAVERATGRIRVTRVVCAHDCGLMINPDCVQSQVEGNVIQALSRALHEEIVYDRHGQLLTASFMDYAMPRAADLPAFHTAFIASPAPRKGPSPAVTPPAKATPVSSPPPPNETKPAVRPTPPVVRPKPTAAAIASPAPFTTGPRVSCTTWETILCSA